MAASGLSLRTLGDIETARRTSYRTSTLPRLERALKWELGTVQAIVAAESSAAQSVDAIDQIARAIERDDFVLVWMLKKSGLPPGHLLETQYLIRVRREHWEREHLWPEVAAHIERLGGTVSYPWDAEIGGPDGDV